MIPVVETKIAFCFASLQRYNIIVVKTIKMEKYEIIRQQRESVKCGHVYIHAHVKEYNMIC